MESFKAGKGYTSLTQIVMSRRQQLPDGGQATWTSPSHWGAADPPRSPLGLLQSCLLCVGFWDSLTFFSYSGKSGCMPSHQVQIRCNDLSTCLECITKDGAGQGHSKFPRVALCSGVWLHFFFFSKFFYLFIYLFIFFFIGCIGSSLLHAGFL